MGDFRKGGSKFGGGRPSGGFRPRGNSFGGDRDRGRGGSRPQLFDAVCAKCGNTAQVPFRPTGDRPVLCKECFSGGQGNANTRPTVRASFEKRIPNFPNPSMPSAEDKRLEELTRQIYALHKKLDAVIASVDSIISVKSQVSSETVVPASDLSTAPILSKKVATKSAKKAAKSAVKKTAKRVSKK